MSQKPTITPLSEVIENGGIIIDQNGCDELGINIHEFILDFLKSKGGGAHEEEIAEAYASLRFEKIVDQAMDQLVEEGLAEYRICPETGEKLFKVHKDAKLMREENRHREDQS